MIPKPKRCTVRQDGSHTFEVVDPNNDSCPLVGPYTNRNRAIAKREANETAKRLNAFYRRNWKLWTEASIAVDVEALL